MHELEGILTIKDSQGNLTHVFYNDIKRKAQICYKVKECGAEDIKQMLDGIAEANIKTPIIKEEPNENTNTD